MENIFKAHNVTDGAVIGYLSNTYNLNVRAIKRCVIPSLVSSYIGSTNGDAVIYTNGITYIFKGYVLRTLYYGNTLKSKVFVPKVSRRYKSCNQKKITISAHATIRYIQRFLHIDMAHIADQILEQASTCVEGANYRDGLIFYVENGILINVKKSNVTKKRIKIKIKINKNPLESR